MMTTTAHPKYPGTDRLVLIGETAHDTLERRTGTVSVVWDDGDVSINCDDRQHRIVPVTRLGIGPAPDEGELVAIRITDDEAEAVQKVLRGRHWDSGDPEARAVLQRLLDTREAGR